MSTPAAITRLTEHAKRAKELMSRSDTLGTRAGEVMTSFEKTLSNFEGNIERVSKEDAALSAALAAMGNGEGALEEAFRDGPNGQDGAKGGDNN